MSRWLCHDFGARGNAFHQSNVGADDGAPPDVGLASQNGGVGVNDAVIAHGRMSFSSPDQVSFSIPGECDGPQGYALVDPDMVADLRRLADYNARSMVDKEVPADFGAWMNVDAGAGVGDFGEDAGD